MDALDLEIKKRIKDQKKSESEFKQEEILECLILMCEQYLYNGETTLHHHHMCAGEQSLDLLARMGLAETQDRCNYNLVERS